MKSRKLYIPKREMDDALNVYDLHTYSHLSFEKIAKKKFSKIYKKYPQEVVHDVKQLYDKAKWFIDKGGDKFVTNVTDKRITLTFS